MLNSRECALARSVFGDALDVARVTVRCAKWWAWQPWWITMAPDGHVWCHPNGPAWHADFSAAAPGWQALFVHELVHVWQYQQGGHLALRRPPFARYRYAITPGRPFHHYGIEQQARMVEDAFLARLNGDAATLARLAQVLPFAPWRQHQGDCTSISSLPKLPPV